MAEVKEPVVAETKPAPEIKIDLDAVKAEEAKRIQDCVAQLRDDSSDATKALPFVSGTTPGDIAMAVNAEVKAMGNEFLANLKKQDEDMTTAGLKAAPVATTPDTKPVPATTPEGWRVEFEASDAGDEDSPKCVFMDAAGYVAFKTAEAAGRIQIHGGKDAR